jgi:hypothetical protein
MSSYATRHIPIPLILLIWLLLIIFNPGIRADWPMFLTITLIYVAWNIVRMLIDIRRQNKSSDQPYYQPTFPIPEGYPPGAQSPYEQMQRSAPQYHPPLSTDQPPLQDG